MQSYDKVSGERERVCMAGRIGYTGLLLALCLAALILPRPAAAAQPQPGDPCTAATHQFQWNTDPDGAGVTNALFCESGTYVGVMKLQATGNVGIGNTAPGSMLDVGKAGTTLGTLRLEGSTSGYVQIQPAAAAGSWTATLPATAGTNGYQLTTDGAGVLSWAAAGSGGPLSGITAATAGNTIANANNAQVWNWDTLTTGTALKIASTSMTTGSLLYVTNTNSAAVDGATVYVNNSQTGGGSDGMDVYSAGNAGVYANATGSAGKGLFGEADTGAAIGVYGKTTSTTANAMGVYGWASGASGATYGVYGETDSTTNNATGVDGYAAGATGATYGVYGQTASTTANAKGVYGIATGATGATYGVFGQTNSSTAAATAVGGYASSATGGTNGVYAESASTTGNGILAVASSATGTTYGVYGQDASATGYGGYFTNTNGGYALATGSGNVGIGTTTPGKLLEISATGAATGVIVQVDATAAANNGSRLILNNTGTGGRGYQITSTGSLNGPGAGVLEFYDTTAAATRMILDSTGRLGIGTAAPTSRLMVQGTSNWGLLKLIGNGTNVESSIGLRSSNIADGGTGNWIMGVDLTGLSTDEFGIQSFGASPTTALSILAAGNVGIGTTAPTATLDVNGTIRVRSDSYVSSDFSKTNDTALAAITGLTSGTLAAGSVYAFDIDLYTTSNNSGGIHVDLNGGSATATTIMGEAVSVSANTFKTADQVTALSTSLCAVTNASAAYCHITGTITVNAGGTFIPRFAQNASFGTASIVKAGSFMTIRQLN